MDEALKSIVRSRAQNQREYCRARQTDEPFLRYQVEHIIAKQHGGTDEDNNLALACPHCNLHKGPNIAGLDPLDNALTALFNPRTQLWDDHFVMNGPVIVGQTGVGRTTCYVLNMNARIRIMIRAESMQGR